MDEAARAAKKLRKQAKREAAQVAAEEGTEEAARLERKALKRAAAEAAAATVDGQGPAAHEPKAKKKKAAVASAGADELARVGDHDAARAGAPLVKSFYTECAALSALAPAVRSYDSCWKPWQRLELLRRGAGDLREALTPLQEVAKLRASLLLTVEPATAEACTPVRTFAEAGFPKNILAACRHAAPQPSAPCPDIACQRVQATLAHPGAVLAHHPARTGPCGNRCHG